MNEGVKLTNLHFVATECSVSTYSCLTHVVQDQSRLNSRALVSPDKLCEGFILGNQWRR